MPHTRAATPLEPPSSFYGAAGAHFPIHSLAIVVGALRDHLDPSTRERLVALRSEIEALPSGQREYVEWVLDNALGVGREVFYGPVDEDIDP